MINDINYNKPKYRQENGYNLIELHLNNVHQLFNSLDPSPFREKDLDHDAESYIVACAKDFHLKAPVKLVIYLPANQLTEAKTFAIPMAIHHYFLESLVSADRSLRSLLKIGRVRLVVGLLFLFCSIMASRLLLTLWPSTFTEIFAESLTILGWVSMWGPVQIFLYEWLPIWDDCKLFKKLKSMPVEIRPHNGTVIAN